jgi:hypothetical protein
MLTIACLCTSGSTALLTLPHAVGTAVEPGLNRDAAAAIRRAWGGRLWLHRAGRIGAAWTGMAWESPAGCFGPRQGRR